MQQTDYLHFFIRKTITIEHYFAILQQFTATLRVFEDPPDQFMHDGSRPQRTEQLFSFLHEYFGVRVIELDYLKCTRENMNWSPYSPNLINCDYIFNGCIERHGT